MPLTEFIQENVILFIAAAGILGALVFVEFRDFGNKGKTLTTMLLTQKVNQGATLIDLRSHEDFRKGHIPGAKNIPMDELDKHLSTLGKKDSSIALYCHRGSISARALKQLQKEGFTDIAHLTGGIAAWQQDSLPLAKA